MKHATEPGHSGNVAAAAGRWSARHRRTAILGWLAFVVLAYMVGGSVTQQHLTQAQTGNGQSARAMQLYTDAFPKQANEQVLVQGRGGVRIDSPRFSSAVADVVARLGRVKYVSDVRSPLARGDRRQLSNDGRSGLVTFTVAGSESQAQARVGAALAAVAQAQRSHPGVRIEEFGDASSAKALDKSFSSDFRKAEYTSLPTTLLILLFAFGALVAAGVPLLLGLTAVLAALGLLGPLSHLVPVAEGTIDSIVLLIGLAVGVDYSMFYLRRKLEERHAGLDGDAALARAAATSGRAVLISGLTVMTAMAGMFLAGNRVFTSFGLGTVLVVAVAIAGSMTVLPAVISKLGDRVEMGKAPIIARRRAAGTSRGWSLIIDTVLRRPAISFVASIGILLAIGLPALGMRTVDPGTIGLPRSLPIMHTYDRIQAAFPGGPTPAVVVIKARDVNRANVQGGIFAMTRKALASGQMGDPVSVSVSPDRTVAAVSIALKGSGTDSRSAAALATLRTRLIPSTIGRVPGVQAYVMGLTASSNDFNETMKSHLPVVFGFVLGLAFVLLLVTFRSVVIPFTAIALNLLSVSAAYGALRLIFQEGYLRSLLGATNIGGVIDWLPLFLFVILFGLSMDYHVLILSRIREEHDRGLPTSDAIARGIKSTAGVVSSAAVVMVAVFSIFATLSAVAFKQVGVGLAFAILIDATLVRAVLLPATMKLLGRWNWYMPNWAPARLKSPGARPPSRPVQSH
jgi:RND superfamily putative drug exporter